MSIKTQAFPGLTGNQLKILAMVTMTLDHIGVQLLPQCEFLRILGRLALPIYAYMIAEGCRYTHHRRGYLLRLAGLAFLCQMVYFFAMDSLYQCILVTFSLSVCLIWVLDRAQSDASSMAAALAVLAAVFAVCELLPKAVPGFSIDYGFFGVLLPVAVYFGKTKAQRLFFLSLVLILLTTVYGPIQWWALGALPLLALYNGKRGTWRMGTFFYLYYPLHLAVIYGVSLFI